MFTFLSCSVFIEKSITGSKVVLDSPAAGSVLTSYSETFHWEVVPDALTYELQIVTPSLDTVQNFLLDTVLRKNHYTYSLRPGRYGWRVRALNGSSETGYTASAFRVDTTSLAGQTVLLSSPVPGSYTNVPAVNFTWQPLFGVSQYQLELDTLGFSGRAAAFTLEAASPSYTFTLPAQGKYSWRVRGQGASGYSAFSVVSAFTYNKTAPQAPVLLGPASGAKPLLPDTLTWQASVGASSYKVYLYKADSMTPYNAAFPASQQQISYLFSGGLAGEKVYWAVSALDLAGNESPLSQKRYFTVGP